MNGQLLVVGLLMIGNGFQGIFQRAATPDDKPRIKSRTVWTGIIQIATGIGTCAAAVFGFEPPVGIE